VSHDTSFPLPAPPKGDPNERVTQPLVPTYALEPTTDSGPFSSISRDVLQNIPCCDPTSETASFAALIFRDLIHIANPLTRNDGYRQNTLSTCERSSHWTISSVLIVIERVRRCGRRQIFRELRVGSLWEEVHCVKSQHGPSLRHRIHHLLDYRRLSMRRPAEPSPGTREHRMVSLRLPVRRHNTYLTSIVGLAMTAVGARALRMSCANR
jgi:hypothetical protein